MQCVAFIIFLLPSFHDFTNPRFTLHFVPAAMPARHHNMHGRGGGGAKATGPARSGGRRKDPTFRVSAEVCEMKHNGWGVARVLDHAQRHEHDLEACVGDRIAIRPPTAQRFTLGLKITCFVKTNSQPRAREKWFATFAQPFTEEKSTQHWEPWQLQADVILPNTVYGQDHKTGWGLACWKCGHAKVSSQQVAQIKNTAVWTNTATLFGTKVDSKKVVNKFKKCITNTVRCAKCSASIGSLYHEKYFDGDTNELTTKSMFPCVKLTTQWAKKESSPLRHAMVITGESKFDVETLLATVPHSDEKHFAELGRVDSRVKKVLLQVKAFEQLADTKMQQVQKTSQENEKKLAAVQAWTAQRAQDGELRVCDICDDEVAASQGISCGGSHDVDAAATEVLAGESTPAIQSHFTCDDCLNSHILNEIDAGGNSDGCVYCPARSGSAEGSPCFKTPLSTKMIASHCLDSTFDAYNTYQLALRENDLQKRLEVTFEERVRRAAKKFAALSQLQKKVRIAARVLATIFVQ